LLDAFSKQMTPVGRALICRAVLKTSNMAERITGSRLHARHHHHILGGGQRILMMTELFKHGCCGTSRFHSAPTRYSGVNLYVWSKPQRMYRQHGKALLPFEIARVKIARMC